MTNELTVIGARPYEWVRDLCKLVKETPGSAPIETAALLLAPSVPKEKTILIAAPSHNGFPTYTRRLASEIAIQAHRLHGINTADFSCLVSNEHESLCEMKRKGIDTAGTNVAVRVVSEEMAQTLRNLHAAGWKFVIVDNVVDTGKTAKACIKAIRAALNTIVPVTIPVLALGDTGRWENNQ